MLNIMEKTIGAFEVRRQFGKILTAILSRGDSYVIERHGEAVAVIVPVPVYEQWKSTRQAFFDQMKVVAARANMDEEEATALVAKAITDVRASHNR